MTWWLDLSWSRLRTDMVWWSEVSSWINGQCPGWGLDWLNALSLVQYATNSSLKSNRCRPMDVQTAIMVIWTSVLISTTIGLTAGWWAQQALAARIDTWHARPICDSDYNQTTHSNATNSRLITCTVNNAHIYRLASFTESWCYNTQPRA